ncbi:MAG: glycoside hydrolase family 9 protein [Chitinophagaceae bacterium]
MSNSFQFWRILLLLSLNSAAQSLPKRTALPDSSSIFLNQIGFFPGGPKMAVVEGDQGGTFYIIQKRTGDTSWKGILKGPFEDQFSHHTTFIADFSPFKKPGYYRVDIPGKGYSYSFPIQNNVLHFLAIGVLKGYYFLRCSSPIIEKYAGKWARKEGHPDTLVAIHPSAASAGRPAGSFISSPGGWYDAGDYNKYIVNSGITMGTLMGLYEDFPKYCTSLVTHIPPQPPQVPDLLREILWNLRWMLTMQDPVDGGVYHKLTNAQFGGMIMPEDAVTQRYVVEKSTAATLDFAAVMAQASRIFVHFPRALPGLADSCQRASLKAWAWATKNPKVYYRQNKMNEQFKPEILTGSYEDNHLRDEWIWAASELYITTRNPFFYHAVNLFPDSNLPLPSWNQVRLLGYYSLLRYSNQLAPFSDLDMNELKKRLINKADSLLAGIHQQAFQSVMGKSVHDFIWGSNSVAANEGILLVQAYMISHNRKYMDAAISNLDYLLGKNPTGYSFVTGFGRKTPMHPHHRPSQADGIRDPVPGLMVAGPNPGEQDHCTSYPTTIADEAYTDDVCAYACNEIAINWNAPMVYLTNAVEALQYALGYSLSK